MAIPWFALLKTVPWTDVITNAPAVANGARKLWNSVAKKSPTEAIPQAIKPVDNATEADVLASLRAELDSLQAASAELHQQMIASSELIKELAEQNSVLIKRVETSRIRLLWLTGTVALAIVLALASLALTL